MPPSAFSVPRLGGIADLDRVSPSLAATLKNLGPDLDEKETEAWHNLIRVLTHEIMNSITPIASLAATGDRMLKGRLSSRSPTTGRGSSRRPRQQAAFVMMDEVV